MITLEDGDLLYHASYTQIINIDLNRCKHGLDFGRGFYLTSSYEQACNYVPSSVKKAKRIKVLPQWFDINDAYINVFKFHADPNLLINIFEHADAQWLHLVTGNREKSLFPALIKKYASMDIIGGKIADDNTAKTLVQYINGAYGQPGSSEADSFALKLLLPNRLKDQFCFRTVDAIKSLEFVRSERYGDCK